MKITALLVLGLGAALLQPPPVAGQDLGGAWLDFRQNNEGHGIKLVVGGGVFQCTTKMVEVGGARCVQADATDSLIQFEVSREMILPGRDTLTFEAEYFDAGNFPLALLVESALPIAGVGNSHSRAISSRRTTGTDKWLRTRWQVTDEAFGDAARDAIRFWLTNDAWWNDGRTLSVAAVRVTHEAVRFRPQNDGVLCGAPLAVEIEAWNAAGAPLPDGTEVMLTCTPGSALASLPKSVTLTGGKATFEVKAGPKPVTTRLFAMPKGTDAWLGDYPLYILAGEGEIKEWSDFVEPAQLQPMLRFDPDTVAESSFELVKDKQGLDVLRAHYVQKEGPGPPPPVLTFGIPFAGAPRRLSVHLGCPDKSVGSVEAEVDDGEGETFSYHLGLLPVYAECSLDCRAVGMNWGGRVTNAVLDSPCTLRRIRLRPAAGWRDGTLDLWGIQTNVLAPANPAQP